MIKLFHRKPKASAIQDEDGLNLTHRQKKLKYLKARRKLRKLEIIMARSRSIARVASVAFIFWLLITIVNLPQWYLPSNLFSLGYPNKYLEIEGNKIVSDKQVLKQLATINLPDQPIYRQNTKPLEDAIFKLAPVKKVYVRRFWFPARLKVVIDEKNPILAISPSTKIDPVAIFTEDTTIIGKDFLPLASPKKLYHILTYDDYTMWSNKHVNYLIYLSKLIEGFTRTELLYLDIRNPDDVFAQLDEIKLRIGELDRTVFLRTKRISDVLEEALKIKDDIEYIDLRWNKTISIKLKNKETQSSIEEVKDIQSSSVKPKENKKPASQDKKPVTPKPTVEKKPIVQGQKKEPDTPKSNAEL
ncbi:MAG: hypothetical protein ACD_20C00346G0031 [uncultured bacterium]|nr:MAG: hypothetical protein ACD_20C00346G0031 [uncultured bacterium]HBH17827.1 hypothetical protein [Cyanobacteria bacterium UBA9579]